MNITDEEFAEELVKIEKLNLTPQEINLWRLSKRHEMTDIFHLTDLGNAKRFVRDHSAYVRY